MKKGVAKIHLTSGSVLEIDCDGISLSYGGPLGISLVGISYEGIKTEDIPAKFISIQNIIAIEYVPNKS